VKTFCCWKKESGRSQCTHGHCMIRLPENGRLGGRKEGRKEGQEEGEGAGDRLTDSLTGWLACTHGPCSSKVVVPAATYIFFH